MVTPRYPPATGTRDGQPVDPAHVARFSVFLGSHHQFDHWGDPDPGWVWYVGAPGCNSGSFGDRLYWRSLRFTPSAGERTPEGVAW